MKQYINLKFKDIKLIKIHFISAKFKFGIKELLESIFKVYLSSVQNVSTSCLTSILRNAIKHHYPPMNKGRRIKLKYANPVGFSPLKIVIHGNKMNMLPVSYKRYLEHFFQKKLKMFGSPVKLFFKNSINPYINN
ncbi:hypothetical protein D9V65_02425 [Buchnera aphidicola (Anoecia oenotherae)]|uniref:GTPase Der C-terminal KH-domain-like domain-containing protein n=2 Tax=Buchnera aphidicola TaxID=9 RepID=A0A4D6XRD4_9GAMM|nr:hypothetical protein D9V65_02425 [Buchnera aphidicola (Anoecia oenotherae)]